MGGLAEPRNISGHYFDTSEIIFFSSSRYEYKIK